jgi:3-hydroxyacyl-CoA dehydrogenase/enoyl-CoA hydratase/3-hydroxybutyryl-CoA epimerase
MEYQHWHIKHDEGGAVWLYLDVADENINVLSQAVLRELEAILSTLEISPPAGVGFISGKASGFIAGADVREFTQLNGREGAMALIKRGQRIMDRIEALPCPTVSIINGFCMGGGLELSLACHYRIALDDPKTRLGLPEIKLGIHPGFGGTVRALRVLGPITAMDVMLSARRLTAHQAKKMGLVDDIVPQRHLIKAARKLIATRPLQRRPGPLARLMNQRLMRPILAQKMRRRVAVKARHDHYPAPYALIDLWAQHGGNEREMLANEAESVADLSTTDTAHNLLRVFMLQTRLKGQGDEALFKPRHVHVIGGGLMGGDIAAWCALQGFNVSVHDTHTPSLGAVYRRAATLFSKRLRDERRIKQALDRLIPDKRGAGIRKADVIIEAIFEDVDAKQSLLRKIESAAKPETLIATNTSSLPLEMLAQVFADPTRLVGLHFFNPVAQLPLLEVVQSPRTQDEVIQKALAFARHIDKLPLKVKSSPGFLVNRILMPYLLEAVILESEGVPQTVIDRVAVDFGMPMGPIELVDTIGLDVGLHVGEILSKPYGFEIPEKLKTMVDKGLLGRKSGKGFYEYKNGKPVRDTKETYRGDTRILQDRLILRFVNEAVACRREGIVEDADLVDAGVIFGTGFAPFRGGPLHYAENEGRDTMQETLKYLQHRFGDRFAADSGW